MGIYGLFLLFLGILVIGLVYARKRDGGIAYHVFFALVLSLFLAFFFVIYHHFEKTCVILTAGNLDQTTRLIRSWGIAGPLMSILLMIVQAIVAPLPAFIVTAANGMVFGNLWGTVISWTGAMMGALTSFGIARLAGDVTVKKIIRNKKAAELLRHAGEKRGFYVILIARLLPFISFDIISYMAGLSGIRPWSFAMATALGMLPATILYTFFGHQVPVMEERSALFITVTVVFIFILIVFSLVQGIRKKG
ncbi:MAG: TVP38/TMEM64 family protein [Deltaproteobacteria bacterium]|nr:TVP38/TMEM64 family protein [Deltaproteobacteria bacterium]